MALPASRKTEQQPAPLPGIERDRRSCCDKSILLIDCDPTVRSHAKRLLQELGAEVYQTETAAQGLLEAGSQRYDLALVASSPGNGADGADTCRRIKALTKAHGLPVVMYATSALSTGGAEKMYAAGCDALVTPGSFEDMGHVVSAVLDVRAQLEALNRNNRELEMENRRLEDRRQRSADLEVTSGGAGAASLLVRELAAGRPDGVLIANSRGIVLHADRGACEMLGAQITGRTLGSVAPASGLEAFVRDARAEAREGFRFEISARKDRVRRSVMGSVTPIASGELDELPTLRVVLMLDIEKRRVHPEETTHGMPYIPRQQLGALLEAAHEIYKPEAIVGRSPAAENLRRRILESAAHARPILLLGERGTGKELVARIVHYTGTATGPFLQLRCAGMSVENIERELFGYVKGAFPGAVADHPGLLLLSRDGTLFLSEVGELPLDTQQRLLDAIEKCTVLRRGAKRRERVYYRLIVSSSQSLEALVAEGKFLPELQRRLMLGALQVPRLCDRLEDLPEMSEKFLARFGRCGQIESLSEEACCVMQQYNWPGNIGELEDCVEQACARADAGSIEVAHLTRPLRDLFSELPARELIPPVRVSSPDAHVFPTSIGRSSGMPQALHPWDITDDDPISLEFYEKQVLVRSLHQCGGDKLEAARLLKVGKSTLYRKLKRFGIK